MPHAMADPLSVISAVVGLIAASAQLAQTSKQLCNHAKDAPASMALIRQEMDQLHLVFVQVEMFVRGTAKKKPSKSRLTMISLHHLMSILSGCVLVFSNLDRKLSEVTGLVDHATNRPVRGFQCAVDRIRWALWKEAEVGGILDDLQRHKSSLHLMLTIIQCNSIAEANESLDRLHILVEKIAESTVEPSVHSHLRELISRESHTFTYPNYGAPTGESAVNLPGTTKGKQADNISVRVSNIPPLLSRNTDPPPSNHDRSDTVSIRTTTTIFSGARSLRAKLPSFTEDLFNSRAYKRLRRHSTAGPSSVIPSAESIFSKDSRATKGDRWSMLSDISLGDLSISEISVLELPITLTDIYDPRHYQQAPESNEPPQRRRSVTWSSRGRIHNSIRTHNEFVLRTLITLGVDLEEKDSTGTGCTPLCTAVQKDNLAACKILLEKGALVDALDSSGCTPLLHVIRRMSSPNPFDMRVEICNLLLEYGANADAADSSGITPLIQCIRSNARIEIFKALLKKGAKINAPDPSGQTPLILAVESGNIELCKVCLDKGANVNTPDSSGCTPLIKALNLESMEICKLLLARGAIVNAADSTGCVPLIQAMRSSKVPYAIRLKQCELLLDEGAMVETLDASGDTPLILAIKLRCLDLVKLLLSKGANVNTPDSSNRIPLSYAVCVQNTDTVKDVEYCKLLLNQGALINTPDSSDRTPLSYAAMEGKYDICRMLVNQNAHLDTPDASGRTPLSYAVAATGSNNAVGASGAYYICNLLLKKGATVNIPDSSARTPLLYAAMEGRYDICNLLINEGAMVDIPDSSGRTTLSYAAAKGHVKITQLLIERGAMVDKPDPTGRTPLSYAAGAPWYNKRDDHEHVQICKLLVASGARVDSCDSSNRSPYLYAQAEGNDKVGQFIAESLRRRNILV